MGLDLAIKNGTIVDGSGAPRFRAEYCKKNLVATEVCQAIERLTR